MVAVGFLSSTANSALPIYPAEIIARDLDVLGAGWAGHVGITTAPFIFEKAYQVIEVLNSKDPIIQINLISDFKTKSPYWGSRYGIADMKASFQSEPVLIAFKSQNKALYTNTVGIN